MRLQHTWNNKAYDHAMDRLYREGFVAYAVGGCVRDAVLGVESNDVDVATNARPHDLPKIFGTKPWDGDNAIRTADNGVALYPTGVAHGTWTIRVDDDEVEITTFRKDVDTDGRRATVEFADTPVVDAQRRDFTMNALYYNDFVGLVDPTGEGLSDLLAGRVRFVGNADERLQEDHLRAMRLFRFHARFGKGPLDREAREAVMKHRMGLSKHVSKERIWDELKKLLDVHDPADAVWEMAATGVLDEVLGTSGRHMEPFARVLCNERHNNLQPNWVHRYTAIMLDGSVPFPASNAEKKRVYAAADALDAWDNRPRGQAALANEFGAEAATFVVLTRDIPYARKLIEVGALKDLPIRAQDLIDRGVTPGPRIGKAMAAAKEFWYATDLRASREALLLVAKEEAHD